METLPPFEYDRLNSIDPGSKAICTDIALTILQRLLRGINDPTVNLAEELAKVRKVLDRPNMQESSYRELFENAILAIEVEIKLAQPNRKFGQEKRLG